MFPRESGQLMELNAKRMEISEALIEDWKDHSIDIVVSPGFTMPAVKLEYAGWLHCAMSYTAAYNVLNFPVGSVAVISTI